MLNNTLPLLFPARIAAQPGTLLMDTGAGANFVSEQFCQRVGVRTVFAGKSTPVTLADGSEITTDRQCLVSFTLNDISFQAQCHVVPLPATIQLILGNAWLRAHQAVINYQTSKATLHRRSRTYHFAFSNTPSSAPQPPEPCAYADVDILLAYIELIEEEVEATDAPPRPQPPLAVQQLLDAYADVFPNQLPAGLPPHRGEGHVIPLEPGSTPVCKAPYRCSPAELAELKSQV